MEYLVYYFGKAAPGAFAFAVLAALGWRLGKQGGWFVLPLAFFWWLMVGSIESVALYAAQNFAIPSSPNDPFIYATLITAPSVAFYLCAQNINIWDKMRGYSERHPFLIYLYLSAAQLLLIAFLVAFFLHASVYVLPVQFRDLIVARQVQNSMFFDSWSLAWTMWAIILCVVAVGAERICTPMGSSRGSETIVPVSSLTELDTGQSQKVVSSISQLFNNAASALFKSAKKADGSVAFLAVWMVIGGAWAYNHFGAIFRADVASVSPLSHPSTTTASRQSNVTREDPLSRCVRVANPLYIPMMVILDWGDGRQELLKLQSGDVKLFSNASELHPRLLYLMPENQWTSMAIETSTLADGCPSYRFTTDQIEKAANSMSTEPVGSDDWADVRVVR